jgi:hypothetical protein
MSIKRLFDAVERRGDIGRRVATLVLPISNRPRVTPSCAGKIGLREPCEHTSGPNLASRDNVAHNPTLYTILETPPPVIPLCRKQARTYAIMFGVMRDGAGCGAEAELGYLLPHPHQAYRRHGRSWADTTR